MREDNSGDCPDWDTIVPGFGAIVTELPDELCTVLV
jgi:hypothetical protein